MGSNITGTTKICGIIGDPVEHSMSPVMHNAALQKLGLDCVYVAFHVRPPAVGKAVEGMRAFRLLGLNVTVPHKVTVMPFLDAIDPLAEKIGAVNTITSKDGFLTGYNTDASGFLMALKQAGVELPGKKAVVVGAGGAARGITFILAENGARLTILNRQAEFDWAETLAGRIGEAFKMPVDALALNDANLQKALAEADILVNATSVGMTPRAEDTPVPARFLRRGLVVFDAVYNPLKTRLLREAAVAGARTISGIDMLVWQGAVAFEKWLEVKPPVDVMQQAAIKALHL